MGVPPVIIHFNKKFHYKPTIFLGYLHLWKPPVGWYGYGMVLTHNEPRLKSQTTNTKTRPTANMLFLTNTNQMLIQMQNNVNPGLINP